MFHTFCPLTTHSSPSRTARVARPREVGARARFGEQLAPDLFAREHRAQRASAQLVAAVRDHGRAREREPEEQVARGRAAPASRKRRSMWRCTIGGRFRPPKPSGKCTHARPRSYCAPRNTVGSVCFGSCAARRSSIERVDAGEIVVGHGLSVTSGRAGRAGGGARASDLFGRCDAAVDRDDRAGDVRAGAAGEVDRDAGHVVGSADAARAATSAAIESPKSRSVAAIIFDSNGPGATALTVMLRGPSWRARWRVSWWIAALLVRVRVGLQERNLDAVDRADVDDPRRIVGGARCFERGHAARASAGTAPWR